MYCNAWCILTVLTTIVAVLIAYYFTMPVSEAVERIGDSSAENMKSFKAASKSAFVVGYTGETGKELVKMLAERNVFNKVTLIGRRKVEYDENMFKDVNVEQTIVDFDKLEESADVFKGHNVGYCCLGTTKGKAGVEGFKKVDRDYVLKTAELAKSGGVEDFHLVSSTGANANSGMLYPQVKGQVEIAVKEMGFERLSVYRPGLLMCEREESRGGEWFLRKICAPVEYMAPGFATTSTRTLAKAMLHVTASPITENHYLFQSKDIQRLTEVKNKKNKSEKK